MKTPHVCHADGCNKKVPPKILMCLAHWKMVPRPLQNNIWKHYRPGQEVDKNPSAEYMVAYQDAVRAVREKEGL